MDNLKKSINLQLGSSSGKSLPSNSWADGPIKLLWFWFGLNLLIEKD